jgi:hypothetical protein
MNSTKMIQLLLGAAICSVVTLTTFAQSQVITRPSINDGSNGSRAPLPVNRPSEYDRVSMNRGVDTILVARHIGGPSPAQFAAAHAPVAPGMPVVAAVASLDASQVGTQLRANPTASRDQIREINARVALSDQVMNTNRGNMSVLTATEQTQLNSANSDMKDTNKTLQKSIKAANTTTGAQLATDYEAYAAAVARMDVIVLAQR